MDITSVPVFMYGYLIMSLVPKELFVTVDNFLLTLLTQSDKDILKDKFSKEYYAYVKCIENDNLTLEYANKVFYTRIYSLILDILKDKNHPDFDISRIDLSTINTKGQICCVFHQLPKTVNLKHYVKTIFNQMVH